MEADTHSIDNLAAAGGSRRTRLRIHMRGVVQGVGFRPWIHTLALARNLSGWILNDGDGVEIEVQGRSGDLRSFLDEALKSPPPLARITDWNAEVVGLEPQETGFAILSSRGGRNCRTLISPDVATCADCLGEMRSGSDRRHHHAFINCTHCGPRFTIVAGLPYDRPQTSMNAFPLCKACRAEYEDPADRRFHAQPIACPDCGPRLSLVDSSMTPQSGDPVAAAASLLRKGGVLAIKGLGGFHLAVDALSENAVRKLRERKGRYEKPLAIMVADLAAARGFARINPEEEALLTDRRRPIVLLPRLPDTEVAPSVAPRNGHLGIMLPYTPLHHLIFDEGFAALVMTSGNLSEEPIAIDNREAGIRLGEIADLFLIHDRPILRRCDDTVTRWMGSFPVPVRRSRGEVPAPIQLPFDSPPLLAAGPEQKNTFCLTRGRDAFLSQHIGDMENLSTKNFFLESYAALRDILEVEPVAVAHDLHPRYLSTLWALEESGLRPIGVQHHHAHIAACMAENGATERCLGLSLDGTGYGSDGTIWGGELIAADYLDFDRLGHFTRLPLPGAERAVKEPWRVALAALSQIGEAELAAELLSSPSISEEGISRNRQEQILSLIASGINTPAASSAGRLFDAASALLGIRRQVSYEGQAAVEMEGLLHEDGNPEREGRAWKVETWREGDLTLLDAHGLLLALARERREGLSVREAALSFHRSLVGGLGDWVLGAAQQTGLRSVALSGGCFMNLLLLDWLKRDLEAAGLTVYVHRQVPAGDGGLSLGQAAIAGARLLAEE